MMIEITQLGPAMLVASAVLLVFRRAGRTSSLSYSSRAFLAVIGGSLSLVPLGGLSISDYLLSLSPVFSVGSISLFVYVIVRELLGRGLFSRKEMLVFCAWNVVVSLVVFSSVLGIIGPDVYGLGYRFSPVFAVTAAASIAAILVRSRLTPVFIAYIAAFDLRLLPSDNLFDYITDGTLFIISAAVLVYYAITYRTSAGKALKA